MYFVLINTWFKFNSWFKLIPGSILVHPVPIKARFNEYLVHITPVLPLFPTSGTCFGKIWKVLAYLYISTQILQRIPLKMAQYVFKELFYSLVTDVAETLIHMR